MRYIYNGKIDNPTYRFLRVFDILGVALDSNLYTERNRILSLSETFEFDRYPNKSFTPLYKLGKDEIFGLLFDEYLSFYVIDKFNNSNEYFIDHAEDLLLNSNIINWMKDNNIESKYFYELDPESDKYESYSDDYFIGLWNDINKTKVLEIFRFPDLPILRLNLNDEISYITVSTRPGSESFDDNARVYCDIIDIENDSTIKMLESMYNNILGG